jgi:large subunit ribosomal protein L11
MAKKLKAVVKLQLPRARPIPAPPSAPRWVRRASTSWPLCKEYNARTQGQIGQVIPVDITIFTDGSFTFVPRRRLLAI